ncbi:MAG: threonine/serine exporter family protein [Enterococcaceae bacterium]|jgi:uncharacterized membrane protein YjjB (DUF3815 family)|nr:threonine/serine exporter family protein [Enterococcaceae bacterium]MCI1919515.1 threonine/serine exporter family protein [Enterococcaceae bacterium]
MEWPIHFLFSFLSTVAFAILIEVPRNALIDGGIAGAFGWMTYYFLHFHFGLGFSNFFAALMIGLFSILFSRIRKMPMIVFNIPSLVPLVPGGPAYQAVRNFVLGYPEKGLNNVLQVIVIAGAIAGGFVFSSMIERLVIYFQHGKKFKFF